MSDYELVAGSTSQRISVWLADSSSSVGAGLASLLFNSAGLTCYYWREDEGNAGATAVTLATATRGTFTSSGFIEKDGTNTPGAYEFGVPNAALAAGAKWVRLMFKGATNLAQRTFVIRLLSVNPDDSVRMGMTALPNATASASNGLLINGSNAGTVTLAALTVTGATTHTGNVAMAAGLTITQSTTNGHGLSVTGNGTGHGVLATSGSGATGDGFKAVAASTNGNGVTFAKTGTGQDFNATSTPLTLAKSTNITGFNDIAATAIVSAGAITTSSGAVSNVTNVANATLTGDFTATMKASIGTAVAASAVAMVTGNVGGSVLGSVAGSVASVTARVTANTDQLAGQAVTAATGVAFPTTIASPTNITAGTITTVGTVTNGVTLAAAAIDSAALAATGKNAIADAFLDRADAIETGLTPRQNFRIGAAALFGTASGLATTTATYNAAVTASKARITATVDANGNRSAVTADGT